MTTDRPTEYLVSLVRELCKLPQETEWLELLDGYLMKSPDSRAPCPQVAHIQALPRLLVLDGYLIGRRSEELTAAPIHHLSRRERDD
jgi:hypothetical protein